MNDRQRLEAVTALLNSLPIQSGASDLEPWAKVHLVDITAIIEVAEGHSDPEDWVSEHCGRQYPEGHFYGHSPHHWSLYEEGRDPLRITHWCNGEVPED